MPNKIADHRRRVVYIEEKDVWDLFKETAKRNGLQPSAIVRAATYALAEKLRENPNARFIRPIFD